jgi:hypothetical protein
VEPVQVGCVRGYDVFILLKTNIYNLAFVCAFLSTFSILEAFMTSPLTLSFPLINSFCAFALPATSCAKSLSARMSVTAGFLPSGASPLPTVPVSLRSRCHDSSLPLFLSVKPKMAPPCLMASLRSAGEESVEAMASKASDEGKSAGRRVG